MFKRFAPVVPILSLMFGSQANATSCADLLGGRSAPRFSVVSDADLVRAARSVPESYKKVATSSHGSLYYSPLAEQKTKLLDELIVDRDMAAEIGGVGLTRIKGQDVFVEDFVIPAQDKIFIIDGLFLVKEVADLGHALAYSKQLQLEVDGGSLVIRSDNPKYNIHVRPELWGSLAEPLSRACGGQVTGDYAATMAQISEKGSVQLRTDWELVVTGGSVSISQRYFDRAEQEAAQKGLQTKFNMHHHPRLGLAVRLFSYKPVEHKQEYFNKLLVPSLPDLQFMDAVDADWFEIRTFGTVSDLGSNSTTAKFYDMREIRERKAHIANVVHALFALRSGDDSGKLSRLKQDVQEIERWLTARNLSVLKVIEYAVGTDKFREFKAEADSISRSAYDRDKLISRLFHRRD